MSARVLLLLGVLAAVTADQAAAHQAAKDEPAVPEEAPVAPGHGKFHEAIRTFASDGRYLLTFPARANRKGVSLTIGFGAATALAMNRDGAIREEVLESDVPGRGRAARKFEPLGRAEVEAAGLGTLYLAARGAKNVRLASATGTAFESYLWSMIITSVSKGAFGRERPGRGSGDGEFFRGDTIFPSGHTARSFAIAAVLADRYGRGTACFAYPIAALIGLSTIQEDLHWASDVVAGAGLGLAIGKGIAARHPKAGASGEAGASKTAWQVVPHPGGAALRIVF